VAREQRTPAPVSAAATAKMPEGVREPPRSVASDRLAPNCFGLPDRRAQPLPIRVPPETGDPNLRGSNPVAPGKDGRSPSRIVHRVENQAGHGRPLRSRGWVGSRSRSLFKVSWSD